MIHLFKIAPTARVRGSSSQSSEKKLIVNYTSFNSPIGMLYIALAEERVCKISIGNSSNYDFKEFFSLLPNIDLSHDSQKIKTLSEKILNYLERGEKLPEIPLLILKATDFELAVWKTALKIQYGEVQTYGRIARKISNPQASRAVGNALGKNPIPLLIPCHRVIRENGSIGGFTGGSFIKKHLLSIESGIKGRRF